LNTPDFDQDQLRTLISDVLDGSVDDAGRASLNALLKASPGARRFYRDHMELHARLHLDYSGGQAAESMPGSVVRRRSSWFAGRRLAVVAAAACLALLAVIAWPRQTEADAFATLEKARAARWESSDLPTTEGSRLGQGTLRLAEGLVTLRFDSGAKVNLEAPVELTLVDAMHCTLSRGIAVADVPDSAKGFRIATPSADVVDYGTRFSVIVDDATGETHTQVYEGLVEVEHPPSGEVVALKAGQLNSANESGLAKAVSAQGKSYWPATIGPEIRGPEWKLLETSKDAYIGRAHIDGTEVHRSETLLLVKGSSPYRKSYLGFDLAGFDPQRIADAKLKLHFAPTGWGLASLVPDATFSVYGLLADQPWDEQSLDERNAPANPGWNRPGLVGSEVRKLGSFLIEQGVQRGQFGIEGESLAEFLRERAGSAVTLIVVRDTGEFETNGLVHGFASRRHPILPAPTLAIRMREP
jgi:ferric-dicitrate binding protein FerR (iron transport regulator)